MDFNTFVCTACSGIHREFSHRIKSISLATFTDEEVEGVKKGGNNVNNALYMARCACPFCIVNIVSKGCLGVWYAMGSPWPLLCCEKGFINMPRRVVL